MHKPISTPTDPDRLRTVREAAAWLGVSTRTLYTLTSTGAVRSVRLGRSVRYDPADLRAAAEAAKTGTAAGGAA